MQGMKRPDEAQEHVVHLDQGPVTAGKGNRGRINSIRSAMTCSHISSICGHVIQRQGRAIQGSEPALPMSVSPIHISGPALHVQTWFAGHGTMRCPQRNLHRVDLR
jgi:hypothetical protein